MKTFIKNTVLMFATLLITLCVCELMARILFKDTTHLMPRYHTGAEYGEITLRRIRSNMEFTHTTVDGSWDFVTNSQGFRNYVDFDYERTPGTVRVVALGDSTTQGHECHQDYTYSATIEKYLNERGLAAEVLNAGVSGFSTAESLLLLREEMYKYQPDYVVLGFFANDYEDNLKSGLFALDDHGNLELTKYEHTPGVAVQDIIYSIPGVQWLGENSYFYSKLFNASWGFFKAQLANQARETMTSEPEFAVATKSEFTNYEVDLTAALIREIYNETAKAGAKLIILDIPQAGEKNRYISSVVRDLMPTAEQNADAFVGAEVLSQYQGVGFLHVPAGNRHPTEFTHTLLGTEVAAYIYAQESGALKNP